MYHRTAAHPAPQFHIFSQFLDFRHQSVYKLLLRHLVKDFSFSENKPFTIAACAAYIRSCRPSGAVNRAAHDGYRAAFPPVTQTPFHFLRHGDQLDAATGAGRTGD